MERDELLRKLKSLAQMDTDAVDVYREALEHVTDDDVRTNYERFQGEHQHHAEELSKLIVRLGGEQPDLKVDMSGRLVDWVTAIRSRRGTEGALHAMETAERYHNRHYDEAIGWDVEDDEVSKLLKRFDEDEKRHLGYIEERLGANITAGSTG